MLSPDDLVEMRALTTKAQRNLATHEDWASLAALTLIWEGDPTVVAIAAGGYAKFKRVAKPQYKDHAFTDADYQRIFARICSAATRFSRDWIKS